jgi:hypothetical protein
VARTWLQISVGLLGGLDIECEPPPVFAVGPSVTFERMAEAIDVAFGRWDLSHLHVFPEEVLRQPLRQAAEGIADVLHPDLEQARTGLGGVRVICATGPEDDVAALAAGRTPLRR